MTSKVWLAAGVSAACIGAAAFGAAGSPPPVANYWVDVATASGFGAGMTQGARPNMSQIMGMMSGRGPSVAHTLELRLASKQKAAAPQAEHLIPSTLAMGPSLPLLTPAAIPPTKSTPGLPSGFERPKGRMLIYWGCGEHPAAGQPTVVDFAKVAAGQVPPGMTAMAKMAARAVNRPGPGSAPGYGEWPNSRDSRAVPANGSLAGAHKVQGNYTPPINFTLAANQDFMPGLNLTNAGALPSGAMRLTWSPAAQATGYALAMFGASGTGDVVMWTSSSKAAMTPHLDYLPPAEVKRLVGTGAVLAPSVSQCVVPAEVAKASPAGMVTMIGYGPEVHFAEAPKAPKWTTKVRYKTTASLMLGMSAMGGMEDDQRPAAAQQQQPRKRKKFGLGDVLKGAIPVPIP